MKRQLITLTAACLLVAGIGASAKAADTTWTGNAGNDNWGDPGNWSDGVPSDANGAIINLSDVSFGDPDTITVDQDYVGLLGTKIMGGTGKTTVLDLNGHTLEFLVYSQIYRSVPADSTLEITGAAGSVLSLPHNNVQTFYRNQRDGDPVEDAEVIVSGQATAEFQGFQWLGYNQVCHEANVRLTVKEQGTVTNLAGKTFRMATTAGEGGVGPIRGFITVQDQGTLQTNLDLGNPAPDSGQSETVLFTVVGADATVDLGSLSFNAGTLNPVIDDLADFSTLSVGALTLGSGVELDVDLDGVTPAQDTIYDIIAYTGSRTGTFTLAAEDATDWAILYDDVNKKIQAKYLVSSVILGDVNGDGVVDGLDIQPFVDLLTGGGYQAEADINADAVVDGLDIQPFVDIITGAGGNPVPEPATLALLAIGGLGMLRRRTR